MSLARRRAVSISGAASRRAGRSSCWSFRGLQFGSRDAETGRKEARQIYGLPVDMARASEPVLSEVEVVGFNQRRKAQRIAVAMTRGQIPVEIQHVILGVHHARTSHDLSD